MRVACLQTECTPFDRDGNLSRADAALAEAMEGDPTLVVLPEYFAAGCVYHPRWKTTAEPIDGPTVSWMRRRSVQHGVWLAGGIVERGDRHVHSTLVLVGPGGDQWVYRKRYLPLFEQLYLRPSREDVGILHTPLGRIGVLLCWDMIHARPVTEMRGEVDLLLVSAAWPDVAAGRTWHPWVVGSPRESRSWLHVSTTVTLPGFSQWLSRPPVHRPRQLASLLGVPVVFCNMAGRFETPVPWLAGLQFDCPFAGTSAVLLPDGRGHVGPTAMPAIVLGETEPTSGRVRVAA